MQKKQRLRDVLSHLVQLFPKKYLFIIGILFTILVVFIDIGYAILIKNLLDATLDQDLDVFYQILSIFIGVMVLQLILTYSSTKILGVYTEGGVKKLRQLITDKMTKVKIEHVAQSHSGDFTSRATNDMANVRSFTATTFPHLIKQPLTLIMALGVLFYLSWKLTLITLIAVPVLFAGIGLLSKPIRMLSQKRQEKLANANTITTDYIKGVEVSKAYAIEDVLKTKYDLHVDESVEYGKKVQLRQALLQSFSYLISLTPFFITFILGGYFVSQNDLTIGSLLAFIQALNYITNPIQKLPNIIAQTFADTASTVRVFTLLDLEEERSSGTSFKLPLNQPIIEFKDVHFSYPGQETKVLCGLNLTVQPHQSIALVGPSGGGKSTLTKLILGYYDHYEGEIKIGGQDLKDWNLTSLRSYLAYVSQDTYLFPESIRDNILYGNLSASNEEIIHHAQQANAHSFIEDFKASYETKVGELGGTLSGGQKQRLAIARAMVKNAPIFLLDEATSALDNESEALVQQALETILKEKTSIIIAHRLSTIKNVNKIVVLKEGQIVEEGSHQELINLDGEYSQLYQKQFKQVSEEGDVINEEEK